jgi:hypothetical protein
MMATKHADINAEVPQPTCEQGRQNLLRFFQ